MKHDLIRLHYLSSIPGTQSQLKMALSNLSQAALALEVQDEKFVPTRCIICYSKDTKGLQGGAHGRKRVREIAENKQDGVCKRLKKMPPEWEFKYHNTSKCYKGYVDKRNLPKTDR